MKYSIISKHRTVLMGVAALWIYVFHLMPAPAYQAMAWWKVPVWFVRSIGFCGVDMFLFLSGFGLAYSLAKRPVTSLKEYGTYIGRRFSRIYQIFLPFALVYGLLADWTLRTFLRRILIIDQLTTNIYCFCWYAVCIVLFYMVAPAYMAAYRRAGKQRVAFTVAVCTALVYVLYKLQFSIRGDFFGILVRIPVFLVGMLAADYSMEERKITWRGWLIAGGMLAVGVVLSFLRQTDQIPSYVPAANALFNVLIAPALCLFGAGVVELIGHFKPIRWGLKIVAFYGSISFELYLMQEWYVSRGVAILPITRLLRHVEVFAIMTVVSWGFHKLGGCLAKIGKK